MALSSCAKREDNEMIISMNNLGDGRILAGTPRGRKVLAQMVESTAVEPVVPEMVFVDFTDVDVATASFLRETVLAFRDTVRRRRSNFYPVIANANDLVAEELAVLVAPRGDVLMLCSLDKKGRPHDQRLVGELDPKQKITFELVKQRKETDAAELMRDHNGSEGVKHQTAWNNRLAALADLGLVIELSQGRAKRYRPLLMEG
jgi:hypothetical protein